MPDLLAPGTQLLQLAVEGVAVGSIIALAAVGLSLTYGILKLANFAHGDLLTLGAYVAFAANVGLGWNIWLAVALGCAIAVMAVLVLDKILWEPLRKKRATATSLTIASIGLALVIRNAIILVWGTSPQRYNLPTFQALNFFGIKLASNRLLAVALAALAIAGVYYLLQHTKIGRAMRAVADSPELARIAGIDVRATILWTWVVAGALTAFGGGMYGLIVNLRPNMGWVLILPMFAAVILGGIGNPYGAIAGAVMVGVAQEVSTFCPANAGEFARFCLGTDYKIGVGLAIVILVLLFRPQGLFRGTM